jgi:hypothetical protein
MVDLDPISRPTADQLLERFSHLYEDIRTPLSDMFQRDPNTRPTATALRNPFLKYSQNLLQEQHNEKPTAKPRSDAEFVEADHEIGASRTKPANGVGPVTFSAAGEKQVTKCEVVHAITNKPNSRIILVCADDEDDHAVLKLCKVSGPIIWEDQDPTFILPNGDFVMPSFNADGTYLIVCINAKITVINAQSGTIHISFPLDKIVPSAVSIGSDSGSIAITTKSKIKATDLDTRIYKHRIRHDNTIHTLRYIIWLNQPHVRLGHIANGRRLLASCRDWSPHGSAARGYDPVDRAVLCSFFFGPLGELSQSSIRIGVEEYHIVQVRKTGGAKTYIFAFGGEGQKKGEFAGGRNVTTFLEDRVVMLTEKYDLLSWNPGEDALKVASLEGIDVPKLFGLKGMAVGENQVVLVRDDGYFLVYRRDP